MKHLSFVSSLSFKLNSIQIDFNQTRNQIWTHFSIVLDTLIVMTTSFLIDAQSVHCGPTLNQKPISDHAFWLLTPF